MEKFLDQICNIVDKWPDKEKDKFFNELIFRLEKKDYDERITELKKQIKEVQENNAWLKHELEMRTPAGLRGK